KSESSWTTTIIRRHPSQFLHDWATSGPGLDAIRKLFDGQSRGPRAEIIEPGPGTPTCRTLCFTAEFITASGGGMRVPCSRALGPGPDRDSVALAPGP